MSFRGRSQAVALLIAMLIVCGCGKSGPAKYNVSGVITFKGEAVPDGIVQFFNPKVGSSGVDLESDGSFDFTSVGGLETGEYQVFVEPPPAFLSPPQMGGPPMEKPKEYPNIPQKYRQAATSGFKVTVDGKKTDLKFDMLP
ncbi:MAG: hypothetical protein JWM11_3863 [Planctomycetaceae bacterium]|nr:hypothetical protein [Planctomycetaceae bacterium]